MIAVILGAIVLIAVLAVVVGIVDAVSGPAARLKAAERREQWEARRFTYHGPSDEAWDED